MPRRKPLAYAVNRLDDINLTPISKAPEAGNHPRSRAHTCPPHMHHLEPPAPCTEELASSPSGLAAAKEHSCCSPRLRSFSFPNSSSSSSSSSYSGRSSSSSGGSCDSPAQRCLYWLDVFLWSFVGLAADLGRFLFSLRLYLPLDVILLRGDYEPLRRKALPVAGILLLALLACWFWVPGLSHQSSSRAPSGSSGTNLAKIQEQLMEIQKQLAEKEARWKETLDSANLQNEETIASGLKVELASWLQEHLLAGSSSGANGVVVWPELRGVLESVEKRLIQDVHKALKEALLRYRSDGTGMPDYALVHSGGKVIKSHYTKPYCPSNLQLKAEGPDAIIQPEVYPGKCWSFRGSYASVTIALSQSINITHVTMEHLPKTLSPTGQIDSAPQDFAVYGIGHVDQRLEGVFLGKFTYSTDGDPIQIFELKDPGKDFYPVVELRILTNWGDPVYTCVYRFRVHGLPKSA